MLFCKYFIKIENQENEIVLLSIMCIISKKSNNKHSAYYTLSFTLQWIICRYFTIVKPIPNEHTRWRYHILKRKGRKRKIVKYYWLNHYLSSHDSIIDDLLIVPKAYYFKDICLFQLDSIIFCMNLSSGF